MLSTTLATPALAQIVALMKDVNEFLAAIGLKPAMGELRECSRIRPSCHLRPDKSNVLALANDCGRLPG